MYRYTESVEPIYTPAYANVPRLNTQQLSQPWPSQYTAPDSGFASSTPTNFAGIDPYQFDQYLKHTGTYLETASWQQLLNSGFQGQYPSAMHGNNAATTHFMSANYSVAHFQSPGVVYTGPYSNQPSQDLFHNTQDPAADFGWPEPPYTVNHPTSNNAHSERGVSMAHAYSRGDTPQYTQNQAVPSVPLTPDIPAYNYPPTASSPEGVEPDESTMSALLDPLARPWDPTAVPTIFGPFETSADIRRNSISPRPINPLSPSPAHGPFNTPSPYVAQTLGPSTPRNDVSAGTRQTPSPSPSLGTFSTSPDDRYKVLLHPDLPPWSEGKEFRPVREQSLMNWVEILPRLRADLAAYSGLGNRPQFEMKCFRGRDTLCISVKDISKANLALLESKAAECRIQILLRKRGGKGSRPSNGQQVHTIQHASSPTPNMRQSPGSQGPTNSTPTTPSRPSPRHRLSEQGRSFSVATTHGENPSASCSPVANTTQGQSVKQSANGDKTTPKSRQRHGQHSADVIPEASPKNVSNKSHRSNKGDLSAATGETRKTNNRPSNPERDANSRASNLTRTAPDMSATIQHNVPIKQSAGRDTTFNTTARQATEAGPTRDTPHRFRFPNGSHVREEKARQKQGDTRLVIGGHGRHRHSLDSNLDAQFEETATISRRYARTLTPTSPKQYFDSNEGEQRTRERGMKHEANRTDSYREKQADNRPVSNKRPSNRSHSKQHKKGNSDSFMRSGTESSQSSFGESAKNNPGAKGQETQLRARSSSAPPLMSISASPKLG